MTPAQIAAILATMGLLWLAQALGTAWLYLRVRALTEPRPAEPPADDPLTIRTLEARLARLEAAARPPTPPREPAPGPPAPASTQRVRRHDRRQDALADGPVLIAVPSLASTPSTTSVAAAAEFDRRFGPIWALADSGAALDEIARETGYPVGQVELILGLRGPRGATTDPDADHADQGGTDV